MNDMMLYVMIAAMFGMFGWAAFEYAKAGYDWWREQRNARAAGDNSGDGSLPPATRPIEDLHPLTIPEAGAAEPDRLADATTPVEVVRPN